MTLESGGQEAKQCQNISWPSGLFPFCGDPSVLHRKGGMSYRAVGLGRNQECANFQAYLSTWSLYCLIFKVAGFTDVAPYLGGIAWEKESQTVAGLAELKDF